MLRRNRCGEVEEQWFYCPAEDIGWRISQNVDTIHHHGSCAIETCVDNIETDASKAGRTPKENQIE
jgi:hypothetical protein